MTADLPHAGQLVLNTNDQSVPSARPPKSDDYVCSLLEATVKKRSGYCQRSRKMARTSSVVKKKDDCSITAWYHDDRNIPSVQAAYLGKLSKWKNELVNQEQRNFTKAVERMETTNQNEQYSRLVKGLHQVKSQADSLPSKHKKLQQEKVSMLERCRRVKTPPSFEPLAGLKIDSVQVSSKKSSDSIPRTQREINERISMDDLNTLLDLYSEISATQNQSRPKNDSLLQKCQTPRDQQNRTNSAGQESSKKTPQGIYRGRTKPQTKKELTEWTNLHNTFVKRLSPSQSSSRSSECHQPKSPSSPVTKSSPETYQLPPVTYRLLGYQGKSKTYVPGKTMTRINAGSMIRPKMQLSISDRLSQKGASIYQESKFSDPYQKVRNSSREVANGMNKCILYDHTDLASYQTNPKDFAQNGGLFDDFPNHHNTPRMGSSCHDAMSDLELQSSSPEVDESSSRSNKRSLFVDIPVMSTNRYSAKSSVRHPSGSVKGDRRSDFDNETIA